MNKKQRDNESKPVSRWVGENVRRLRSPVMNQSEFAERMSAFGYAWDKSKVSRLENGQMTVDVDKLMMLATVLGVTTDRLLSNPDDPDLSAFDRLAIQWRETIVQLERSRMRSMELRSELDRHASQSKEMRMRMAEVIFQAREEANRIHAKGAGNQ